MQCIWQYLYNQVVTNFNIVIVSSYAVIVGQHCNGHAIALLHHIPSAEACVHRCHVTSGCVAILYKPRVCWLKSQCSDHTPLPFHTTFIRKGKDMLLLYTLDIKPSD